MKRFLPLLVACILAVLLCAPAAGQTASGGVSQTIALEIARQEMVRQRLNDLIAGFAYLAMDARSNGEVGKTAEDDIAAIIARLRTLKEDRLTVARNRLEKAQENPAEAAGHVRRARREVEIVLRELGSLLLRAGMSRAEEVFVDELSDMASRLEQVQSETFGEGDTAALVDRQERMAGRLERLLEEVDSLGVAQEDPLATVRVRQARHYLVRQDVGDLIRRAAKTTADRPEEAARMHGLILGHLSEAEQRLQEEAELHVLVRARTEMEDVLAVQREVLSAMEGMTADDFVDRREALAERQRRLWPPLRPVNSLAGLRGRFDELGELIGSAAVSLVEKDHGGALESVRACEDAMTAAMQKVQDRIDEMRKASRLYGLLQDATARTRRVQALIDHTGELIDETDKALSADGKVAPLAERAVGLQREAQRFLARLPSEGHWVKAMRNGVQDALAALQETEEQLRAEESYAAADAEQRVMDALEATFEAADRHTQFLERIWALTDLGQDLRTIARHARFIRDEQETLIADLKEGEDVAAVTTEAARIQGVLSRAVAELQDQVCTAATARRAADLLGEARGAMDAAHFHLTQQNRDEALSLLQNAVLNLEKTGTQVDDLVRRTEYLAQMMEALQRASAQAVFLLDRQVRLRKRTEKTDEAEPDEFEDLARDQDVLLGETSVYGDRADVAPAYEGYAEAAGHMEKAVAALKGVEKQTAVGHQKKAEDALRRAKEELFAWFKSLERMSEEMGETEPMDWPQGMDLIQGTLLLAMEQWDLRHETRMSPEERFSNLMEEQERLRDETRIARDLAEQTLEEEDSVYIPGAIPLDNAQYHMTGAWRHLSEGDREKAVDREYKAEKALRQALAQLTMSTFPAESEEGEMEEEEEEGTGGPIAPITANMGNESGWRTFFAASPKGKPVAKDSSEWESLTEREREALNENFARELPLEFREMLRDYYIELSKMR